MANFLKEESARMKLKAEKFARRSKIMKKAATMRQDRARQTVASLRPRAQLRVDLPWNISIGSVRTSFPITFIIQVVL